MTFEYFMMIADFFNNLLYILRIIQASCAT